MIQFFLDLSYLHLLLLNELFLEVEEFVEVASARGVDLWREGALSVFFGRLNLAATAVLMSLMFATALWEGLWYRFV